MGGSVSRDNLRVRDSEVAAGERGPGAGLQSLCERSGQTGPGDGEIHPAAQQVQLQCDLGPLLLPGTAQHGQPPVRCQGQAHCHGRTFSILPFYHYNAITPRIGLQDRLCFRTEELAELLRTCLIFTMHHTKLAQDLTGEEDVFSAVACWTDHCTGNMKTEK